MRTSRQACGVLRRRRFSSERRWSRCRSGSMTAWVGQLPRSRSRAGGTRYGADGRAYGRIGQRPQQVGWHRPDIQRMCPRLSLVGRHVTPQSLLGSGASLTTSAVRSARPLAPRLRLVGEGAEPMSPGWFTPAGVPSKWPQKWLGEGGAPDLPCGHPSTQPADLSGGLSTSRRQRKARAHPSANHHHRSCHARGNVSRRVLVARSGLRLGTRRGTRRPEQLAEGTA